MTQVPPDQRQPAARPWLSDHFINLDLPQIEERRLFGKPRLRFGAFVVELAHIYEVGALLGAARPECVEDLMKICFGRWDKLGFWLDQPPLHLSLLEKNSEPSYLDLIFELFYSRLPPDGRLEFLRRNAKREQPREDAFASLRMVFVCGIAFGARFPELAERFYSEAHATKQNVIPEARGLRLKALGLKKRTRQDIPFAEWQRIILSETSFFVTRQYPDLLTNLRLQPTYNPP